MTETEQQDVETLCENWATLAPLIAEVRRRTGLTETQSMILWLGSQPHGDEPEPWQA